MTSEILFTLDKAPHVAKLEEPLSNIIDLLCKRSVEVFAFKASTSWEENWISAITMEPTGGHSTEGATPVCFLWKHSELSKQLSHGISFHSVFCILEDMGSKPKANEISVETQCRQFNLQTNMFITVTLRLVLALVLSKCSSVIYHVSHISVQVNFLIDEILTYVPDPDLPSCKSAVCPDGSICNNFSGDLSLPAIQIICNNAVSGYQQNPIYN